MKLRTRRARQLLEEVPREWVVERERLLVLRQTPLDVKAVVHPPLVVPRRSEPLKRLRPCVGHVRKPQLWQLPKQFFVHEAERLLACSFRVRDEVRIAYRRVREPPMDPFRLRQVPQ